MIKKKITAEKISEFAKYLVTEEKSDATAEKYLRDVRAFAQYAGDRELTKELAVEWKKELERKCYKPRSVNSMLASLNSFLEFAGAHECRVKSVRIQRSTYLAEDRELTKQEYRRLIGASAQNKRLNLIIRTICATGIRVSELRYFTVQAVTKGEVTIKCKSKTRTILIPGDLRKMLLRYCTRINIQDGVIFITRGGKPVDRSYIWAQMKGLCEMAGVNPSKVFPHNLRKLFARTFYGIDKDIAKLADILGHSSIETTRIYIMTSGTEHRRQIEKTGLAFYGF